MDVPRSLVANPEVTVEVAGHTDNTGPRALNERLSQERADTVKVFLIANGVAAEQMTTKGYAWDQPVASNKTASGRAQNRRTELRRTDTGGSSGPPYSSCSGGGVRAMEVSHTRTTPPSLVPSGARDLVRRSRNRLKGSLAPLGMRY
jgi:hypothetical protein